MASRAAFLFLLIFICNINVFAAPTIATQTAVVRALNKQTGRATDITIPVGSAQMFENLAIEVKACYAAPEYEAPESAAFLRVVEARNPAGGNKVAGRLVFSGWVFSSSPSLSAMEHPIHDIWVIKCGK